MSLFSCIITRVLYIALCTAIGSCYLWTEALLSVRNDRGVLNQPDSVIHGTGNRGKLCNVDFVISGRIVRLQIYGE
jgi:hypothetical protein